MEIGPNYRVVVRTPVLVENLSDDYESPVDYVYKPPTSDVIKENEEMSISLSRDEIDYGMSGQFAKSVINKLASNRDVSFEVMYESIMKKCCCGTHRKTDNKTRRGMVCKCFSLGQVEVISRTIRHFDWYR